MVVKLWERGRPSSGVHPDSLLAGNRDSESTEAIPIPWYIWDALLQSLATNRVSMLFFDKSIDTLSLH